MNFPIVTPALPDMTRYNEAVANMASEKTVGPAYFQRRCGVTYNGALAVLAALKEQGRLGPADKFARHEVLSSPNDQGQRHAPKAGVAGRKNTDET